MSSPRAGMLVLVDTPLLLAYIWDLIVHDYAPACTIAHGVLHVQYAFSTYHACVSSAELHVSGGVV